MVNQKTSSHTKSNGDTGSPDSAQERRASGIPVLSEMPWGSHTCVFYETEQDLLEMNAAYFEAGLDSNEFCIWAPSDPIDYESAKDGLRRSIPDIDRRLASGQMELFPGSEWYLPGGNFNLQRITGGWNDKLRGALAKGFAGMRLSGNAFWTRTNHWKEFNEYERELDHSLEGQKMIALCTYRLSQSTINDLLDVGQAHQFTLTRRRGRWDVFETPELKEAKREIRKLNAALDVLSNNTFPGQESLTSRERVVLAQIIRGLSSKEIARTLKITPRTVEFHRANLLRKTNARSTLDLMRIVLGE